MIRHAQAGDLPRLIALWREAFGEGEAEARFYFANRHRDRNMLVYQKDEELAGMLTMLPIGLRIGEVTWPARYVFAVATKKTHRQQGVSSRLLEAAHAAMTAEGSRASVLVPASPDLFAYYGKRGYTTLFHVDQVQMDAKDIAALPLAGQAVPCTAEEYYSIREKAFAACSPFVSWDEEALSFVKLGNEATGGAMLKMKIKGQVAAAVCEDRGSHLRVTEFAGNKADWQQGLALIHQRFQSDSYQVMLPDTGAAAGEQRPFGMVHWLGSAPPPMGGTPYLAFAKD